jgi:hypothetical protein
MSFEYPEPFVGPDAIQHHLGDCSRMTLWRYMRDGMPAHKSRNGRYLFKLSEVDAWMFDDQDDARFKRTDSTAGSDVA